MIKRLLVPNDRDYFYITMGWIVWGLIVVGCLVAVPNQRYSDGPDPTDFFVFTLMAILAGVSFSIVYGRCHRFRAITITLLAVLGPWLISKIPQFLERYPSYQFLNFWPVGPIGYEENKPPDLIDPALLAIGQLLCVLVGSLVVFAVVRLGAYLVFKAGSRVSRKKILIIVAVTLFLLKILGDVLPLVFPSFDSWQYVALLFTFAVSLSLAAAAYFVPQFLMSRRFFWTKFLLAVFTIVAVLGTGWYLSIEDPNLLFPLVTYCVCVIFFLTSCFGCVRLSAEGLEAKSLDSAPQSPSKLSWLPSLCPMLVLALFGGSIWAAFQVDEEVLIRTGDWKQAVAAQRIVWDSAGAVKMITARGDVLVRIDENTPANALEGVQDFVPTGQVVVEIQLTEDTPVDVLKGLKDWPITTVTISGYGPQVDFSVWESLENPFHYLHLAKGELSTQQLEQILSQPISNLYVHDLEVPGKGTVVPAEIAMLMVHDCSANFWNAFKSFESVDSINVSGPSNWPALARASSTSKIYAQRFETIPQPDELAGATKQLTISSQCLNTGSIDDVRQLLKETGISINCYPHASAGGNKDYLKWIKLAWQFPDRLDLDFFETELGLEFAHDDQGQVTGLLLADDGSQPQLEKYPKLKILSLDPSWLAGEQCRDNYIRLGNLSAFSDLEAIYYVPCAYVTSPQFYDCLGDLKKLRHLQVPARHWNEEVLKFDARMNLESICVLGVPDVSCFEELKVLPKLKKFTIVDSDSEFSDSKNEKARLLKKIKALLPNATVLIETAQEQRSKVPPEFKAYKQKLLAEDDENR